MRPFGIGLRPMNASPMNTTPEAAYKPYLDGVRGLSILLVAFSHGGLGHVVPGGLGVTIFFFISGYLITMLLLKEMREHGTVKLGDFYMRRLWRLMPALIIYIFLSLLTYIVFKQSIDIKEPLSSALYFSNYYNIFVGYEPLAGTYSPYSVLWSLAIEEHFYLFFAPLMVFVKTKRFLIICIVFMLISPLIIRGFVTHDMAANFSENYTYYATDARMDSIAYGCLLAIIGYKSKPWLKPAHVVILALIGLLFTLTYRDVYFRQVIRYSAQGICLYFIFGELIYSKKIEWLRRILSTPLMVFVGKLSYSLYLYHWIVLILMIAYLGRVQATLTWQAGYWVLSFGLASLSYYFVERPTLKLRVKYGSRAK